MYKANWFERLLCKLSIHDEWNDTLAVNLNTEETPVYFFETVTRCHRCPWQNPRP